MFKNGVLNLENRQARREKLEKIIKNLLIIVVYIICSIICPITTIFKCGKVIMSANYSGDFFIAFLILTGVLLSNVFGVSAITLILSFLQEKHEKKIKLISLLINILLICIFMFSIFTFVYNPVSSAWTMLIISFLGIILNIAIPILMWKYIYS